MAGAWMAWWHEVSRIPVDVSDPSVAERKLQWWAQASQDAFQRAPDHPLLKAIHDHAPTPDDVPPLPLWLSQIEGLMTLTGQTRWMDETTLVRHMQATTGAASAGLAWALGGRSPEVQHLAHDAGLALRRSHILFRLGQDCRQGWLHLPIDRLQTADVKAHELLRPASPQPDERIRALLQGWSTQALDGLATFQRQAAALPQRHERAALRPALVLADLHVRLHHDIAAQGFAVTTQRLSLGAWRKLWTAQKSRWHWLR